MGELRGRKPRLAAAQTRPRMVKTHFGFGLRPEGIITFGITEAAGGDPHATCPLIRRPSDPVLLPMHGWGGRLAILLAGDQMGGTPPATACPTP
ncbi:hypothetical protein E2C01_052864 [Portunus trituberculatus]|uniref:Uncharacterized protein n=1 Tax=Portunus trituberculatus TaxID=210409 RepID=A0A5B7GQH7_PORTR|nr:hypothetical protein [Portunus trituberculatus]